MADQEDPRERKHRATADQLAERMRELGIEGGLEFRERHERQSLQREVLSPSGEQATEIVSLLLGYTFVVPDNGDLIAHIVDGTHVQLRITGQISDSPSDPLKPFKFFMRARDLQDRTIGLEDFVLKVLEPDDREVPGDLLKTGNLRFELELGSSYRIVISYDG